MSKRSFSTIAFLVAGMLSTANALEVRPLAQIQIPGKDKMQRYRDRLKSRILSRLLNPGKVRQFLHIMLNLIKTDQ